EDRTIVRVVCLSDEHAAVLKGNGVAKPPDIRRIRGDDLSPFRPRPSVSEEKVRRPRPLPGKVVIPSYSRLGLRSA
ncbi:MAG: hypothetical protein ACE5I3_15760, partial [Phycisphaerae bacterium]